jgi:ribosomal protein S27AE|tara:strand:- start:710 stop:961 length:252 start_codon:yes stop_codon:yes gene_type:complete
MAKYKCPKCSETRLLSKQTITFINNKIVTKEAFCENCEVYMDNIDKPGGFGKAMMRGGKALSRRMGNATPSGRIGDEKINIHE